jgi:hypothetical protein
LGSAVPCSAATGSHLHPWLTSVTEAALGSLTYKVLGYLYYGTYSATSKYLGTKIRKSAAILQNHVVFEVKVKRKDAIPGEHLFFNSSGPSRK